MTRLPIPGSDDGAWGDLLNTFLAVSHKPDGTLLESSVTAAGAYKKPSSGIPLSDLDAGVQTQIASAPVSSVAGKTGAVSLVSSDVGLGNVDNTSDATKNSATTTLTNKTISGASNTLSNIPESAVTNLTTDLSAKVDKSTATTKGDLLVATGSATISRLGVGTDNKVLTANSAQGTGLAWADTNAIPTQVAVKTASYTLAGTDMGTIITFNSASAMNLTVNTGIGVTVGQLVTIMQLGSGAVTVNGTATVNSRGGARSTNGQYATMTLICYATDVWNLSGDIV